MAVYAAIFSREIAGSALLSYSCNPVRNVVHRRTRRMARRDWRRSAPSSRFELVGWVCWPFGVGSVARLAAHGITPGGAAALSAPTKLRAVDVLSWIARAFVVIAALLRLERFLYARRQGP